MKTLAQNVALIILFFVSTAANLISNTVVVDAEPVIETMKLSSWRITSFSDDDTNYEDYFLGYNLYFLENNVCQLSSGNFNFEGKWGVKKNINPNSKKSNSVNMLIQIQSESNLDLISQNWRVIERTDSKVKLSCNSNQNSNYFIILEKNI